MFFSFIGFVIGAILGSFSTALIFRVPLGISFIKSEDGAERSKCTSCGHILSYLDLVPILSWIFLRGRCRYCKNNIGVFYFLLELFSAMSGAVIINLSSSVLFNFYIFMIFPFLITFIIVFFRYRDLSMVRFMGFIIAGISACTLVTQLFLNGYS